MKLEHSLLQLLTARQFRMMAAQLAARLSVLILVELAGHQHVCCYLLRVTVEHQAQQPRYQQLLRSTPFLLEPVVACLIMMPTFAHALRLRLALWPSLLGFPAQWH